MFSWFYIGGLSRKTELVPPYVAIRFAQKQWLFRVSSATFDSFVKALEPHFCPYRQRPFSEDTRQKVKVKNAFIRHQKNNLNDAQVRASEDRV